MYKARLGRVGRNAREVAVKTLKGLFCHEIAFYYEEFSYVLHNPSQCCINGLIVLCMSTSVICESHLCKCMMKVTSPLNFEQKIL